MIAGTAFAAWLADRGAQAEAFEAVEASAASLSRHPLMVGIERELAELSERTPNAILAVARRFIDQVGPLDALMCDLIASCRDNPFYRPPLHPVSSDIHSGLMLYNHPDLSIAFGVTGLDALAAKKSGKRGVTSIGFTGLLTSFRYVKSGNATISFWEAPPIADNFISAEAGKARFVARRRIEDGEEIVIDGRHQSFVIEHAESDMVYFQALVRCGGAPVAVEYDSASLAFVNASSTDEVASRVQMMVSLLRTIDRQDAVPLIAEALNSPQFYTRWHVMRELLAMDAEIALPHLRRMADADPHPEVRGAARQTLALFFDEDEPLREQDMIQCRG